MQAIKCEICGSSEIVKQNGLFVCQYCGTKYSADEVRSLLGIVKIDKSEDTENYLTLARRALNEYAFEKAEEYYELILRNDPNNIEAIFYRPYCNAMKTPVNRLLTSTASFRQSLYSVFNILASSDQGNEQKASFVNLVIKNTLFYCNYKIRLVSANIRAFSKSKDPDDINYFNAVCDGLFELSRLYSALEQIVQQRYPSKTALLHNIRNDELIFYNSLGHYFMKAIPLMKEKKRLKNELQ